MKKNISAKDLAINLSSQKEEELFKWLLACLLFGKPIQQEVAKKTYFEFIQRGMGSTTVNVNETQSHSFNTK